MLWKQPVTCSFEELSFIESITVFTLLAYSSSKPYFPLYKEHAHQHSVSKNTSIDPSIIYDIRHCDFRPFQPLFQFVIKILFKYSWKFSPLKLLRSIPWYNSITDTWLLFSIFKPGVHWPLASTQLVSWDCFCPWCVWVCVSVCECVWVMLWG